MYMIRVLHGDNTLVSRQALQTEIDRAKTKGIKDVVWLDGKKVSLTELIQATQSQSLFGGNRLVIVEHLFARKRSKEKDSLIKSLNDLDDSVRVIVWEAKRLTPSQSRSLTSARVEESKLSKKIFAFLDSVKPGNTKVMFSNLVQSLDQDPAELIFALLVSRVQALIRLVDGAEVKGAAWQVKKLQQQAQSFSLAQLMKLHHELLQIDVDSKTGQNQLDVSAELTLLIAKL